MPKLTSKQVAAIERYVEYRETRAGAALALAADGWNVFPLAPGSKVPLIGKKQGGNGALDGTQDADQIREWWGKHPKAGIGANLGTDRIAFDIDVQHGGVHLSAFPETRVHHSGRGNGNLHLIYRIAPGSAAAGIKSGTNVLGPGIDIRAGVGSYIVMPPTPHESTGRPYRLDPDHRHEHTLTDEELEAIWAEAGLDLPAASRGASRGLRAVPEGKTPSRGFQIGGGTLEALLDDPPAEGGRNDWLARVAGHLAKVNRGNRNAYERAVWGANLQLSTPLENDEVEKTLESIWSSEEAKNPEPTEQSGWLVGNKRSLFCRVAYRDGDETTYSSEPWADFDLEARGVAIDSMDRRVFWLYIYWGGKKIEATLPAEVLGSEQQTKAWLAARGLTVDPPGAISPKTMPTVRLMRYLNNQHPPEIHIASTLGWDDDNHGFVTHDGLVREEGMVPKESAGVVADPKLVERDVAPYVYGFSRNKAEARRVLREVLTFQDPVVCSVFGSWWAATFLKPQIQQRTAIFPFFGVEAASESGKTNGFFDLMVALNGNTRGQVVPTRPVLRDYASANKSGIVWADDLDTLEPYGELLRASTSNGTASKMDVDRTGVKNTDIVNPILITGEALGFGSQKALVDRSILMPVKSPKDRKSLRDPSQPQWNDVLELRELYPDSSNGLSSLAGWYVQQALEVEPRVIATLREVKKHGSGRHADKLAVLRAGARLLDHLVGHDDPWSGTGEHARRVEQWIKAQGQVLDQDNTLTSKILPWALQTWGLKERPDAAPEMGRFAGIADPVFVKGDIQENDTLDGSAAVEVWYSPVLLARAWARDNNNRVDQRTETQTALVQQAAVLGGKAKAVRLQGGGVQRYRLLPTDYARKVIERAQD